MTTLADRRPNKTASNGGYGTGVGGPTTQRSYARFLKRHRWLLVAAIGVGGVIGAGLAITQPTISTAVTQIAVTGQEASPGSALDRPRLISLDSDAQVLTSSTVLRSAAAATDFPDGERGLADSLSVGAIPNSQILIVRVSTTNPDQAMSTATAVAERFLEVRAETGAARASQARERLETQVGEVSKRLVELRASASSAAGVLLADDAEEERVLVRSLAQLQAELARSVSAAADPGSVVSPAQISRKGGGRPMAVATVASGILLGGVAGLAFAFAREQLSATRPGIARPWRTRRSTLSTADTRHG